MKGRPGCLLALLIVCVAAYGIWEAFEYRFHLNLLPRELGVWWIYDTTEESWGFGPGGNETGVIVYALPAAVANEISEKSLGFFSALKHPEGWRETPVAFGALSWAETQRLEGSSGSRDERLGDFLNRYGFGIAIPAWVERLANDAIVSPGNFYAYDRGGSVIIVIPKSRRVVLAYAG